MTENKPYGEKVSAAALKQATGYKQKVENNLKILEVAFERKHRFLDWFMGGYMMGLDFVLFSSNKGATLETLLNINNSPIA
jgi:hypothetical protein